MQFEGSAEYGPNIGHKFYADGRVRHSPGNTVICPIAEDHPVYEKALWVQQQLESLPFADKYTFLPPSSFHMTVLPLLLDAERTTELWSRHLPLDASLDQTDQFFLEGFGQVPVPQRLRMAFQDVQTEGKSILLTPADAAHAAILENYRDVLAEATGVRHPDHDIYGFHISLLYQRVLLTHEERMELAGLLLEMRSQLREELLPFDLGAPQFVLFDDMHAFVPRTQRRRLRSRPSVVPLNNL